ncbi:C-type lectin domain family 4 member F [Paroedura picta]|uniref:C-type lectin domain family 4 member F n=1 Tax=Paroedura picta TaxID=143630 RepID=UPI004057CB70
MAPKADPKAAGKADPKAAGKAEPKAAKGKAGEAGKIDPVVLAKNKKILTICGVLMLLSLIVIIVLSVKYSEVKELRRPLDYPFRQLRGALASAVNEPQFLVNKPKDVAEEVQQLPVKIEKSNKVYVERKKQYQTLFKKATASSSGPWQFHGKSLYYFSKGEKNWYEAEDFCISRGAHLASILDQEEQNFISSQLQHTSWIGLTTEYEDGAWKWSDGSRLVQEYWYEQPSNSRVFRKSNQDCAMMVPTLPYRNWKDNNCHKLYRWVCKENLDLVEQ